MKRILLLLAIVMFSCSTEEEPEPTPQVMEYKVQVSDICDVTSENAIFTVYCISKTEYDKIQNQLKDITPGNAGCATITFKNQSGSTITGYHKSSASGTNTCSL